MMMLLAALPLAHAELPEGTWVLRSTPPELEAEKAAALERTLEPLSFPVALIAKGRLESMLTACQVYRFEVDEQTFQVTCDSNPTIKAPRSGEVAIWVSGDGKSHRIKMLEDGEAAVIRFEGKDGFEQVRYALDGNGGVAVEKAVHSDQLPVPLRWTIRYGPG